MAQSGEAEVDPAWLWIWRAWVRLHLDRRYAGGDLSPPRPQPIRWETIRLWCEWHGYGQDDLDMLDHCFARMDAEFVAWWTERQPKGRR